MALSKKTTHVASTVQDIKQAGINSMFHQLYIASHTVHNFKNSANILYHLSYHDYKSSHISANGGEKNINFNYK